MSVGEASDSRYSLVKRDKLSFNEIYCLQLKTALENAKDVGIFGIAISNYNILFCFFSDFHLTMTTIFATFN